MELATFGAGCFWGAEHIIRSVPGVLDTRVGFMGGASASPSYDEVCRGESEHIEVVEVTFDPRRLAYIDLLRLFWQLHDPTSLDDQGPYERGTQYRSAVFAHDDVQMALAHGSKASLEASGVYDAPIVTEIRPATAFWPAEESHQQYIAKGGAHHCSVFSRPVVLAASEDQVPQAREQLGEPPPLALQIRR